MQQLAQFLNLVHPLNLLVLDLDAAFIEIIWSFLAFCGTELRLCGRGVSRRGGLDQVSGLDTVRLFDHDVTVRRDPWTGPLCPLSVQSLDRSSPLICSIFSHN
jgi:hypothetical protein